jgi:PhnB protein
MSIATTTHLNFRGDARAALEFYQSVFGGELVIMTYADMQGEVDPADREQVVWGQVETAGGFRVMAFDILEPRPYGQGENAFFVSVRGDDADEVNGIWERLSAGASVLVPIGPSQWSPLYGMLTDRFGITWVIDVA